MGAWDSKLIFMKYWTYILMVAHRGYRYKYLFELLFVIDSTT